MRVLGFYFIRNWKELVWDYVLSGCLRTDMRFSNFYKIIVVFVLFACYDSVNHFLILENLVEELHTCFRTEVKRSHKILHETIFKNSFTVGLVFSGFWQDFQFWLLFSRASNIFWLGADNPKSGQILSRSA